MRRIHMIRFSLLMALLLAMLPLGAANAQRCSTRVDHVEESADALDNGDYEAALDAALCAVDIDDQDIEAYYALTRAYWYLDDYENMRDAATDGLDLDDDARLFALRGEAYYNLDEYDLALADTATAIELDPEYAFAYGVRTATHAAMRNYAAAVEDARVALELADNDYVYVERFLANGLMHLDELDEALDVASNIIDENPDSAFALYTRALVYLKLGELRDAERDISAAVEILPDNDSYLSIQAEILFAQGDYEEGVGAFSDLLERYSDDIGLNAALAFGYAQTGETRDSEDNLDAVVGGRLRPESIDIGDGVNVDLVYGEAQAFSFEGSRRDTVTISLTDDDRDAYVDTVLLVLDPDGTPIGFDDNSGVSFGARIRAFSLPDDGEYTVLVMSTSSTEGQALLEIEEVR